MKLPELKAAIANEWRETHHNASLLGVDFPDGVTEEDVNIEGEQELRAIEADIKERFGVTLTLLQYGRGGATVAPSEWVQEQGGFNGGLNLIIANVPYSWEASNGLEYYNKLRMVLAVLEFINERVALFVRGIEEWEPVTE